RMTVPGEWRRSRYSKRAGGAAVRDMQNCLSMQDSSCTAVVPVAAGEPMPLKDILAALVVIVVWGANFVAIKIGVDEIPPMLLGALRFLFVAFPAVFFVPRPAVSWRYVVGY